MKKIEFINDSAPYLSAENLNLLQDNIEESINGAKEVVVSVEEPTTGEEVWIQKGKNLYNPKNAYKPSNALQNIEFKYQEIKTGEKYIFKTGTNWTTIVTYNNANEKVRTLGNTMYCYEQEVTIQEGETYFITSFYAGADIDLSTYDFTKIILEKGEKILPKKIHTKNNNGIYEEFYNEEEHNKVNYSTSEQRIGTFLGKPLYRQVFSGLQCPNNGISTFTNMKQNTDKIIRLEGIFTDKTSANEHWFVIFGKTEVNGMGLNFNQYSGVLYLVSSKDMSKYTCDVIMEYTKTTD